MLHLKKSLLNSNSVLSLIAARRHIALKAAAAKSFDEIPGPPIMPVIGSFLSLKGFGKRFLRFGESFVF